MSQARKSKVDKDLEEIKKLVEASVDREEYNLFAGRLNAGANNYMLADFQLREMLEASSTISIGDIRDNWPEPGTLAFVDRLQRGIKAYDNLRAATIKWGAFLRSHQEAQKLGQRPEDNSVA